MKQKQCQYLFSGISKNLCQVFVFIGRKLFFEVLTRMGEREVTEKRCSVRVIFKQKKKSHRETTEPATKADHRSPCQNPFITALSYVNSASSPQRQGRTRQDFRDPGEIRHFPRAWDLRHSDVPRVSQARTGKIRCRFRKETQSDIHLRFSGRNIHELNPPIIHQYL